MKEITNEIRNALRSFGYKGAASITNAGYKRFAVIVNGAMVGIYDADKGTFVD